MAVSPCKNCEERDIGCHGYCIAYRKWKAEHDHITLLMHEDRHRLFEDEGRMRKGLWSNPRLK